MAIRADQIGQGVQFDGTKFVRQDGVAPTSLSGAHGVTGTFAAGAGTASKADSTWTGGTGSTAYTVGDIVANLKALGLLTP